MSAAVGADLANNTSLRHPSLMPNKQWSTRQQIQSMNDFLSLGPLDRWDFWTGFASSFWAPDSPAALRLRLGAEETDGIFEVPSTMVAQFFMTWAMSGAMKRLFLNTTQATECSDANGAVLTCPQGSLEAILLEGALLVRQQVRIRCCFDTYGRISLLDLQIYAHDEYVLSAVAGPVLASNGLSICRYGFPMGVHRQLELLTIVREMFGETIITTEVPWGMSGQKGQRKKKKPNPLNIEL